MDDKDMEAVIWLRTNILQVEECFNRYVEAKKSYELKIRLLQQLIPKYPTIEDFIFPRYTNGRGSKVTGLSDNIWKIQF